MSTRRVCTAIAMLVALPLAVAACGSSSPAGAASSQSEAETSQREVETSQVDQDPLHYSGSDRATYLTECAKKEGQVEVYTAQDTVVADALKDAFVAKYPGINVNSTRRTAPATAEAVSKEASAGVNKVDVVQLKTEVVESILDLFADFDSPEMANYPESAIGPDKKYVDSGYGAFVTIYNTDHISESEAPKSSNDLLDPQWSGKIAMSTTGPGSQWIGWMNKKYGLDFIKAYGQQHIHTSAVNSTAIAQQVASGDAWIAPAIALTGLRNLDGAPIKWIPADATKAVDTIEIAKKAPHPCAAMLYTDFVLSKEGQSINTDYLSARNDVKPVGVMADLDPVGVWELVGKHDTAAYQADLKEWQQLIDQYVVGQ